MFGGIEDLLKRGGQSALSGIKKLPGILHPDDEMPHTPGFAGGDPAGDLVRGKSQLPRPQAMPMPQQQAAPLPQIGGDAGPQLPLTRLQSPNQTMDQVSTSTPTGAIPAQIPSRTVPLPTPSPQCPTLARKTLPLLHNYLAR